MAFEDLAAGLNAIMILAKGVAKAADDAVTSVSSAVAKLPQLILPGVKAAQDAGNAMGEAATKASDHWFIIKSRADDAAQRVQQAVNTIDTTLSNTVTQTQQAANIIGTTVQSTVDTSNQLLEDMIAHQKDKITAIENTLFGGYLDDYKKLIEHQAGFDGSTSPLDRIETDKGLQGIEKIIRDWTGKAGQDFNFQQFKDDILALLKNPNGIGTSPPMVGGKPVGGTSSGTAGSPSAACPGDKSGGSLNLNFGRGALK